MAAATERSSSSHQPFRVRAFLLGTILILVSHVWLVQLEIVRYSFPTIISPFYSVVFLLLLLTLLNWMMQKLRPQWALSRLELLVVYVMLSVASAVHSSDMLGVLVSMMGYAFWYATPENRWGELFLPRLPTWLTVRDHESLRRFYEGGSTLYSSTYLQPWLLPCLAWTGFTLVLAWTMVCLCVLLRRQWVESERLTYPLVELPLALTTGEPFFCNRLMWCGFGLTAVTTLLNGLSYLYPGVVPDIPLKRQSLAPYLANPPWNAIAGTQIMFYPFGIAMGFLMPLELSLSCWVFYWIHKFSLVASAAMGADPVNGFPYHRDQAFGAYLGLCLVALWRSRRAFRRAWDEIRCCGRRTLNMARSQPDGERGAVLDSAQPPQGEPLAYRLALLSVIGGFVLLVVFARTIGMSLWLGVVFFWAYFALAILASRIHAEFGFPVHDLHYAQPHQAMTRMFGTGAFGQNNLIALSLFHWFNRVYRSHPMPHMSDAFKLSERTGSLPSGMMKAVVIALLVGVPASFWAYLDMYYRRGAATSKVEIWALGFGSEAYNQLANWISAPTAANPPAVVAAVFGLALTLVLSWARTQSVCFPLHPLAYAIANGWGMHNLWLCVFLGWLLKWLLSKYVGMVHYRKAIPFFAGVILGEFTTGSVWTLVGMAQGKRTYDFWP